MLTVARVLVCILISVAVLDSREALAQDCRGVYVTVNKKGFRPDSQVTYYFRSDVSEDAREAIRAAFIQWTHSNRWSSLNVSFSESQGSGNILITMAPPEAFSVPNAAASSHPGSPPNEYQTGGLIRFTTNTNALESQQGFYKAALHEIGHLSGLGDRVGTDRKTVMNQFAGKDDAGNNLPFNPTTCDAKLVVQASRNWDRAAGGGGTPLLGGGGSCPGGGCFGYQPFPVPCAGSYGDADGWCYGGTIPESFPNSPRPITYNPPGIVILSPGHGSTVGSTVDIRVASGDRDGTVMGVEYYANGQRVNTTFTHPYSWTIYNAPPGTYTLQAKVFDNMGLESWSSPVTFTVGGGPPPPPPADSVLSPGERIYGGQRIYSGNGSFYLEHQGDGNLVFYGPGGPTWASMAFGGGGFTTMQGGDGNLVSYNAGGAPIWATMTFSAGSYLNVQDDGNLVIYTSSHVPICLVNALQPGEQCP